MKLFVRFITLRIVLSGSAPVGERGRDVDFLLDLRTVTANRCGFLLRLFDLGDSRRLGLTILDYFDSGNCQKSDEDNAADSDNNSIFVLRSVALWIFWSPSNERKKS